MQEFIDKIKNYFNKRNLYEFVGDNNKFEITKPLKTPKRIKIKGSKNIINLKERS